MIDYIRENCILPPLSRPQYDEDSNTYDLYFEEAETEFFGYHLDRDIIAVPFDTLEEATETLKKIVKLHYDEEDTKED